MVGVQWPSDSLLAQGQATFSVSVGSYMTLNSPSGLQRFLSNPSPSPS